MPGLIRCPAGKGGVVTGIKLAVWFAADGALFLCGAGGSAAGVSSFLYDCAASCALFHMMFSVIGRFPSAALMCAGDGRDGGRFFVVANAALSAFGSRFGGGRFLCDLPLAVGVGGFFYICVAIVASLPMVSFIRCPAGKGGVVTGIKLAVWFAADGALFLCGAGGSAAGVSSFLYDCAASCALFHMMFSVIGRFPSAALMCAGDGRDGGRFFVVANAALSAFGSRFGGGRFLCDLPLAVGVGGFFYICAAS